MDLKIQHDLRKTVVHLKPLSSLIEPQAEQLLDSILERLEWSQNSWLKQGHLTVLIREEKFYTLIDILKEEFNVISIDTVRGQEMKSVEEEFSIDSAINSTCPCCGKAIQKNSLAEYRSKVVGFCSEESRDHFAYSLEYFDQIIDIV